MPKPDMIRRISASCAIAMALVGAASPATARPADPAAPVLRTPPMGWDPWNAFRTVVDEAKILRNAEQLNTLGLSALGYRYVIIDDGWWVKRRQDGSIQVRTTMFPSADLGGGRTSLRPFVDRVHAMGLKAGIYTDIGRNACSQAWDPDSPNLPAGSVREREIGSFDHQPGDARQFFGEWGFDYIKIDACGLADFAPDAKAVQAGQYRAFGPWVVRDQPAASRVDRVAALYAAFGRAARSAAAAAGRPDPAISICVWGEADVADWAHQYSELWRTSPDIRPTWASMLKNFDTAASRAAFAGPGNWNDPDMLEVGNGEFDRDHLVEARSHMSLWAMLAAPLIISTDLTKAPRAIIDILGNRDVIAIDQDRAGNQATVLDRRGDGQVLVRTLDMPNTKAVALINRGNRPLTMTFDVRDGHFAAEGAVARDVWTGAAVPVSQGRVQVALAPRETRLLRISGQPLDPGTVFVQEIPARISVRDTGFKPADRSLSRPWVPVRIGALPDGSPVRVGEQSDATAVGMAPQSRISIALDGRFRRFQAEPWGGKLRDFRVLVDGRPVALGGRASRAGVDVDVSSAARLDLIAPRMVNPGRGYAWSRARLIS